MKRLCCIFLGLIMLFSFHAFAEDTNPFKAIRINEVCASCSKDIVVLTNDKSPDWIELYNDSDDEINLKGLCLSDSKKKLEKYVFDDITIAPRGYLVIYCTGEEDAVSTALCAPFKLSSEGEKVVLSYKGEIFCKVSYDKMEKDTSYAINDQTIWSVTAVPTPGEENVFVPVTSENVISDNDTEGDLK